MYKFGRASEERLSGVLPGLVTVVRRALVISHDSGGPDFSVVYGVRTAEQQAELFAAGSSHTLKSAHMIQPDGYGHAVDLVPYFGRGVSPYPSYKYDTPAEIRKKLRAFEHIARAMFEAADEHDLPLQWGNDWDVDGIPTGRDPDEKGYLQDMPHYQFPPQHRVQAAIKRAEWRRTQRAIGQVVTS